MNIPFTHPSGDALAAFAADSAQPGHDAIRRHLERCASCRDIVVLVRRMEAEKTASPPPPPHLLARIQASRASGQRIILPHAEPVRRSRVAGITVAAGIAALAIVGSAILARRGVVAAMDAAGELIMTPAAPLAGATVSMVYNPSPVFRRETRLVLRGHMSTASSPSGPFSFPSAQVLGTLQRDGDVFRASLKLPDSVVFAALVVENADGTEVDHNDRRFWEIMVHAPDGRPSYRGLEQKARVFTRFQGTGVNWDALAAEATRLRANLYPDSPAAWASLEGIERFQLGRTAWEKQLPERLARFHRLDSIYDAQPNLTPDMLRGILSYAGNIDDVRAAYWSARLRRAVPDLATSSPFRTENDLQRRYRATNPTHYLAAMDSVWERHAGNPELVMAVSNTLGVAITDPRFAERWIRRFVMLSDFRGRLASIRVIDLAPADSGTQVAAIWWLRSTVARLDSALPEDRVLGQTREEQQRVAARARATVLARLARSLLVIGDTAASLDALKQSASAGWEREAFAIGGKTWLAIGYTDSATRYFAMAAADPASSPGFNDSVRVQLGFTVTDSAWSDALSLAKREMANRILADRKRRTLPAIELKDSTDRVVSLSAIRRDTVTVLVYWSRNVAAVLPRFRMIADRLKQDGVRLVTIVDEPRTPEFMTFIAEKQVGLPIYYDFEGTARRALRGSRTPAYYILDRDGQVAFENGALDEIVRQALSLNLQESTQN